MNRRVQVTGELVEASLKIYEIHKELCKLNINHRIEFDGDVFLLDHPDIYEED